MLLIESIISIIISILFVALITLACWDHGRINDLENKVIDIIKVLNK